MSFSPSRRFVAASWLVVAAWAGFIFFASAHTGSDFNNAQDFLTQLKKWVDALLAEWNIPGLKESSSLGHFCEYAVFDVLLANALRCHMPWQKACLVAVAVASGYGVTDEFHQLFVPGRACDPLDWVVDTCGAALGSFLCFLVLRHGSRV